MSQAGLVISSGGGGGGFSPNQVIQDFDDFIDVGASNTAGKLMWTGIGGGFDTISPISGTATNPGILSILGPNAVSPTAGGMTLGTSGNSLISPFVLGGGSYSQNFVIDLNVLSDNTNEYVLYIGLGDYASTASFSAPQSGCWFQYTNSVNGGNWQIVCSNSSIQTVNNTSTPASTGFHNYGIQINSTAASVSFTIDGVVVANSPITTNITTQPIGPIVFISALAGTIADMYVDLFYYTQVLTVPR